MTAARYSSIDDSGGRQGVPPPGNVSSQIGPDATSPPRPTTLAGKIGALFEDKLEKSRGRRRIQKTVVLDSDVDPNAGVTASANPFSSPRGKPRDRMVVPEGVVIEGSLDAAADAEISGRVNGNVSVARRLRLGPTGCIVGDARCHIAHIDGIVQGKVECGEMLDLGPTGRLNSDAMSGQSMTLAGQVHGNLNCGGKLHITSTAVIEGNIRSRSIAMDDGAILNGACSTRNPESDSPCSKGRSWMR